MMKQLTVFGRSAGVKKVFCELLLLSAVLISAPGVQADSLSTLQSDTAASMPDGSNAAPDTQIVQKRHEARTAISAGILFGSFSKDDGPFYIEGNVVIPSGQILEFGPACTVYVGGEYSTITVFGQLFALGTKEDPVVFMSANMNPQPWDWDRIYCRNRSRSRFEHCVVQHSNYGIFLENGTADIIGCRFDHNSLHGVVVKNSDLSISGSEFTGNHVVALNILEGASVIADSLVVRNNITALFCAEKSRFILRGGSIASNSNGLLVADGSSVEITGADVTRNKIGLTATVPIAQKLRQLIYDNNLDLKVISAQEMKELVREPQPVASMVLTKPDEKPPESYITPGFSALGAPEPPASDFIGNVTAGFVWYAPRSGLHPREYDSSDTVIAKSDGSFDTLSTKRRIKRYQMKYTGEQSDNWYSGFQPQLQFFANGRRGSADINLQMDLYGDQWLSTSNYIGKNMFNLSMNYEQQSLVIGDFFEGSSETSMSGRQMTGLRYSGRFMEMGRGEKRVGFKLAAGETEIAKDSGDHEIFVYNQSVDTGMSKRQQITYLAEVDLKPSRFSTIVVRGIIAHDQTGKPLFRKSIGDPAAPDPVAAKTGCIAGNVLLFDQKLELYGEIDLGSADTLPDSSARNTAWYNPRMEKAVPEVFSLFNRSDFTEHFAALAGARGRIRDYTAHVKYMQVAPSFFSAGNPYMVTWRKNMIATVEKPLITNMNAVFSYEFDRTTLENPSDTTQDNNTDLNIFGIAATYETGENMPSFSIDYSLQHEQSLSRESVQREDTGYSAGYREKELCNIVALEGKQTLSNGISYSLRYQLVHDNDYSEHPDKGLNDEGDRIHNAISGSLSWKIRRIVRNRTTVRLAFKHENRDSLRAWQYRITDQLTVNIIPRRLACTVTGEYSRKSEKEFETDFWIDPMLTSFYSAEMELRYSITARLSCTVMGRYEKSYDEITGSSENYSAPGAGFHMTYLF